ncbi:MAG: prephenate dehydrogenase/arogenate dehydrogenase family protein [Acidobacteriota bacterium]
MIVVMEETATEAQVSQVLEKIIELGFDIYRTTGARYTILGAVGSREVRASDVETLEVLPGVKDIVRISGPSVKKIKRAVKSPTQTQPESLFKQVTIFGVGLIGGSFALALRQAGLAEKIFGCGDKKFLEPALTHHVIDGVDDAFEKGEVSDADLIYLAAPVSAIIDFIKEKGQLIKPGTLVTDAGSAKRDICKIANECLPDGVQFIGGHPMAGSHRVGVEFASADLFKHAPYVMVADNQRPPSKEALENIKRVVQTIGGRSILLTAEQHDEMVARISHAPQLLSIAVALAVEKSQGKAALTIAGRGFADMSRLAQSSWSVWEDIVEANTDYIASALAEVIIELQAIQKSVETKDLSQLQKAFQAANDFLLEAP